MRAIDETNLLRVMHTDHHTESGDVYRRHIVDSQGGPSPVHGQPDVRNAYTRP